MLIRWVRRLLGFGDVYVVQDDAVILGVSASLQGAELIRNAAATRLAFDEQRLNHDDPEYQLIVECRRQWFYRSMRITNFDVQDDDR